MGCILNDENLYDFDDWSDYVHKKPKMNIARGIGRDHCRFNFENADVYTADFDKDIGISKYSGKLARDDDEFNGKRYKINAGIPRERRSRILEEILEDLDE